MLLDVKTEGGGKNAKGVFKPKQKFWLKQQNFNFVVCRRNTKTKKSERP